MSETTDELRDVVCQALTGRGAHVLVRDGIDGLDWQEVGERPVGTPHSIFQILNHLVYWQDFSLAWIDGAKPDTPEHAAESWPGDESPRSQFEWETTVTAFQTGLDALDQRARNLDLLEPRSSKTVLEILQLISSHNSYHLGQIAWARRSLGAWPPPRGGATW